MTMRYAIPIPAVRHIDLDTPRYNSPPWEQRGSLASWGAIGGEDAAWWLERLATVPKDQIHLVKIMVERFAQGRDVFSTEARA